MEPVYITGVAFLSLASLLNVDHVVLCLIEIYVMVNHADMSHLILHLLFLLG